MAQKPAADAATTTMICKNRRALHAYAIVTRMEAGLVLTGTEVKACRQGKAQLQEAYIQVKQGEAFLIGAHIAEYGQANRFNHEPLRTRKLLLHRREIDQLDTQLRLRGMTAIALAMYFKSGRAKLAIGLAQGKTKVDRRHDIKEREARVELARVVKQRAR